jgi:hypothetical protein
MILWNPPPEWGVSIAMVSYARTVVPSPYNSRIFAIASGRVHNDLYAQQLHLDIPFNHGELTFTPIASRGPSTDFGP